MANEDSDGKVEDVGRVVKGFNSGKEPYHNIRLNQGNNTPTENRSCRNFRVGVISQTNEVAATEERKKDRKKEKEMIEDKVGQSAGRSPSGWKVNDNGWEESARWEKVRNRERQTSTTEIRSVTLGNNLVLQQRGALRSHASSDCHE
ncbi:hypothetical protein C8R47DRAFT_1083010 [Mycena vitilis]|nr:hypothetical protein C8R47DRAFT_1083010 [Mycena vitilis]